MPDPELLRKSLGRSDEPGEADLERVEATSPTTRPRGSAKRTLWSKWLAFAAESWPVRLLKSSVRFVQSLGPLLIQALAYARSVAAHTSFVADVGLDIYLIVRLYRTGNLWWASLTVGFVSLQYLATMFAIFGFVGSTVFEDEELAPEDSVLMLAVCLGPLGIFTLDLFLAVRAYNGDRLYIPRALLRCAGMPDDYGKLEPFFQWYSGTRIAYESFFEAFPQVALQTYIFIKFALVTHEEEYPINPYVLGLSLVTSSVQLGTHVGLGSWRAGMFPWTYMFRLGQGVPLDELAANTIETLHLPVMPTGAVLTATISALKDNSSVQTIMLPRPAGIVPWRKKVVELSAEQLGQEAVIALLAFMPLLTVLDTPFGTYHCGPDDVLVLSANDVEQPFISQGLLRRSVLPAAVKIKGTFVGELDADDQLQLVQLSDTEAILNALFPNGLDDMSEELARSLQLLVQRSNKARVDRLLMMSGLYPDLHGLNKKGLQRAHLLALLYLIGRPGSAVRQLNVSFNPELLVGDGAARFLAALKLNPYITRVDIMGCNLSDEHVPLLTAYIESASPALASFHLFGNSFTTLGRRQLEQAWSLAGRTNTLG